MAQIAFYKVQGSPNIYSAFDNGIIRATLPVEWVHRDALGGGIDATGKPCKLGDLPVHTADAAEVKALDSYSNALRK
jgi:hypothetical protein